MPQSKINEFGRWLLDQKWSDIYSLSTVDEKVETFQKILIGKYYSIFPIKEFRVSEDDKPWVSKKLKILDRKRRREFYKHKKSLTWQQLNAEYKEQVKIEKSAYYKNFVEDLKVSKPGLWYSKIKRMGALSTKEESLFVEELSCYDTNEQANKLVEFYASTRNTFEPINHSMFPEYMTFDPEEDLSRLLIDPSKIPQIINKMNKKSSSVPGDLPMKLISEFSIELSLPLTHIINSIFETKVYPKSWKKETLTPIPKTFPLDSMKDLRPISGLANFAKIFDRILAEYMTEDLSSHPDVHQYGNQKGLSVNHYLVNLIHKVLTGVDKNSADNKNAAVLTMLDWSQAFERQSHYHGIQSFISNGIRKPLIPLLINFFIDREIIVKWNKILSSAMLVAGGGPQGGTAGGILEYLSQTSNNLDFLEQDEGFKFIDDASFVEILNLFLGGLSKLNSKPQVPSDLATNEHFLKNENFNTQQYLNKICTWTDDHQMKLNSQKTKYMIVNFCSSYQFQTRLYLKENLLEQIKVTRLLGVLISDDMKWHANTDAIILKANKRLTILRNLINFNVKEKDLIHIYILYIRSVLEQSCVVWGAAITDDEAKSLERVQKVSLHLIYQQNYKSYQNALQLSQLPTLDERRSMLSLKFALKCINNDKTKHMFPLNASKVSQNIRHSEKFEVPFAYHERLKNSAIPKMARQLNEYFKSKGK